MVDGVGVHVAGAGYDTISLLSGLLSVKWDLWQKQEGTIISLLTFRNFISFTTENHLDYINKKI